MTVGVAKRQSFKLRQVVVAVKSDRDQPLANQGKDQRHALQVERRLGQHRFASEQGFRHLLGDADGPRVVLVGAVGKRHQKSRVGDTFHAREKPFRDDRSLGPRTEPAKRMKDWRALAALAFSSWSRTILP
jgi:hypothetical protein